MAIKQHTKQNIDLLKILLKLSNEERKYLIKKLNQKEVDYVCSVCYNILFTKNGLLLGKKKINRLRKEVEANRKEFLKLSNKAGSLNQKKRILSQQGKGLGTVLSVAIPLLSSILPKIPKLPGFHLPKIGK